MEKIIEVKHQMVGDKRRKEITSITNANELFERTYNEGISENQMIHVNDCLSKAIVNAGEWVVVNRTSSIRVR